MEGQGRGVRGFGVLIISNLMLFTSCQQLGFAEFVDYKMLSYRREAALQGAL